MMRSPIGIVRWAYSSSALCDPISWPRCGSSSPKSASARCAAAAAAVLLLLSNLSPALCMQQYHPPLSHVRPHRSLFTPCPQPEQSSSTKQRQTPSLGHTSAMCADPSVNPFPFPFPHPTHNTNQVLWHRDGLAIITGLNSDAPLGTKLAFVGGASGWVPRVCAVVVWWLVVGWWRAGSRVGRMFGLQAGSSHTNREAAPWFCERSGSVMQQEEKIAANRQPTNPPHPHHPTPRSVLLWHRSDNLAFVIVTGGASLVSTGEAVECKIKGVLQVRPRSAARGETRSLARFGLVWFGLVCVYEFALACLVLVRALGLP